MEPKELKLPNYNNCLACEAFIQIHFAPPGAVNESDLQKIYVVRHEDNDIFMRLVDMLRIPFNEMQTLMTMPATAMEAHEWKAWWMEKYPQTKPGTMMCVYYYKKKR